MTPIFKADAYLARAAQARGCYVALFEAACLSMPVHLGGEHNVECHFSARDLAEKLPGRSPSVVRNELRWLVNNGWVLDRARSLRFLGRRIDGSFHLLADVAALQATGEERLVSRLVLNISLPGAPATAETTKRGTARQWTGDENAIGGGDLDLAPRTPAGPV